LAVAAPAAPRGTGPLPLRRAASDRSLPPRRGAPGLSRRGARRRTAPRGSRALTARATRNLGGTPDERGRPSALTSCRTRAAQRAARVSRERRERYAASPALPDGRATPRGVAREADGRGGG